VDTSGCLSPSDVAEVELHVIYCERLIDGRTSESLWVNGHPPIDALARMHHGLSRDDEVEAVECHVLWCHRCLDVLQAFQQEHPSTDELEVYILKGRSSSVANRVSEHLADCPVCRDVRASLAYLIFNIRGAL
jgi:hypothetical protein